MMNHTIKLFIINSYIDIILNANETAATEVSRWNGWNVEQLIAPLKVAVWLDFALLQ